MLGTQSQSSIPFHRQAGLQPREAQLWQGLWDIVIHAPYGPWWVPRLSCLIASVLPGSLPRKKGSQGARKGFLRFHGAQNLQVPRQAHGNSQTSLGKWRPFLVLSQNPPLASVQVGGLRLSPLLSAQSSGRLRDTFRSLVHSGLFRPERA